MRKDGMMAAELLAEAVGIVSGVLYIGLQIYYCVSYSVDILNVVINIAVMLLVYAGLSLLQACPERVNGLSPKACTGRIRTYTIRMVRAVKLIFIISLLFTSICDVMGIEMNTGYSLVAVVLIVAVAIFYEFRIIKILREGRKK